MLIGVVVLFVTGILTVSSSAKFDPEAVLGLWLFDEGSGKTAADSSGNKNHGKFAKNPKWVRLKGADGRCQIHYIMDKGLKSWLGGVTAIDPSGKLTATWVGIKAQEINVFRPIFMLTDSLYSTIAGVMSNSAKGKNVIYGRLFTDSET